LARVGGRGGRELLQVIRGLGPPLMGRVSLHGQDITRAGALERWRRGIAYVPEDRLGEGLVPSFTVTESAVLRDYCVPPVARGPLVSWAAARAKARALMAAFQRGTPNDDVRIRQLSGGNQQRLLIARE